MTRSGLSVSVVVPVLNEAKTLSYVLDDIVAQTAEIDTVLVVDGGSTDGTIEIASDHECDVVILDNPDRRVPNALNIALDRLESDVMLRLDGHCRVGADYVRTLVEAVEADATLGGAGGVKVAVAETRTGSIIAALLNSKSVVGGSEYHWATTPMKVDHIPFGAYRTGVARHLGGWDTSQATNQDFEFDRRIRESGYELQLLPDARIDWMSRESARGFFKQYFRYGQGRMATMLKHPRSISPRHVFPLLLSAADFAGLIGFLATGQRLLLTAALAHLGLIAGQVALSKVRLVDKAYAMLLVAGMQFAFASGQLATLLAVVFPSISIVESERR